MHIWIRSIFLLFCVYIDKLCAKHCLDTTGTYYVNFDIVLDKRSYLSIAHGVNPAFLKYGQDTSARLIEDSVNKYFQDLFKKINGRLINTDIRLAPKIDFLDRQINSEFERDYCVDKKNILNITEDYVRLAPDRRESGKNVILVASCGIHDETYRGESHLSNLNRCSNVIGVIYRGNDDLENHIREEIVNIVKNSENVVIHGGRLKEFQNNMCSLLKYCHSKYTDFGVFYENPYMDFYF